MPRRRKDKVDSNQPEIVKLLLDIPGISVEVGHDDILVGYRHETYWYEIKNPDTVSKKTGKILDSAKKDCQIKLEKEWRGHYKIVASLEDILDDLFIKRWY